MATSKVLLNPLVLWNLRKLVRNFPFDAAGIGETQLRKLRRLLVYSYERHPFYRRRMDDAGFDPRGLRDVTDLRKLPILEKEDYRELVRAAVAKDPTHYRAWHRDGTSGSTGKPITVYRNTEERAYIIAKWLRELVVNGYRWHDRTLALVSPHRLTTRDSFVQRAGIMRRYAVSYLEAPAMMVDAYERIAPDFLYANKSQLVQMAMFIRNRGVAIRHPRMYACGAETLDLPSRKIIQDVFGAANMFETYGSVELGILAFQVLGQNFMHFCHDTNVLELENHGRWDTNEGACVITDLHTFGLPLIRYRLGDWLTTEVRDGLRLVTAVRGRLDDWLTWKDGTRTPFHAFYEVMERRSEVMQFRIVQETYDLVRILVIAEKGKSTQELADLLVRDFAREVRPDVTYVIEYVDQIEPDPSGKLRMVISHVAVGAALQLQS